MSDYGITQQVHYGFEIAVNKVKTALDDEGFHILSEIDIDERLEETLGVTYQDYRILGVAAMSNAHKTFTTEREVGLLFPYNVIIYVENGDTYVSMIQPTKTLELTDNKKLQPIAEEAEESLKAALENI